MIRFLPTLSLLVAAALPLRAQDTAPKPPSISVVEVEREEIAETLRVTGTLVARDEVLVGVDVSGLRLLDLLADVGDVVAAGQVLARLDPDTLEIELLQNASELARAEAEIAQAESRIAEAEASKVEADLAFERARSLESRGVTASQVLDEREAAAAVAAAQLASARQGLVAAQAGKAVTEATRREIALRRSKTDLRAPSAGVILTRAARIGTIVSSQADPLFTLARDGMVELAAEVTEVDLVRLRPGMEVVLTPSGTDTPVTGTVRLVPPRVDPASRLGEVRIALPSDANLKIGAFGRGDIELARTTAVVVPTSAVLGNGAAPQIQVVRDGRIETRDVRIGLRAPRRVEIVEGLAEGEVVVLRAGTFVQDGDTVTPVVLDRKEVTQ